MEDEETTGTMGEELESQVGGAVAWWAPDRKPVLTLGTLGMLSVAEQPGQRHTVKRHLWGGRGKRLGQGGKEQAGEPGEKAAAATWVQAGKTKARLRQEGQGLEEERYVWRPWGVGPQDEMSWKGRVGGGQGRGWEDESLYLG